MSAISEIETAKLILSTLEALESEIHIISDIGKAISALDNALDIISPPCDQCGGHGYIVVEEYLMSTGACPKCNKKKENTSHPGDALCYGRNF